MPRAVLLLICLALATPALSSLKGDQVPRTRHPGLFLPAQKVIMNDGKYALVDGASVNDRNKDKRVEVTCPTDMKALSAGFRPHREPAVLPISA